MERAVGAAGEKDVQIGGGVSTVCQYLEAQLVDELHVAIAPPQAHECTTRVPTAAATHTVLTRSDDQVAHSSPGRIFASTIGQAHQSARGASVRPLTGRHSHLPTLT
jgi:dihydrofolate reductase